MIDDLLFMVLLVFIKSVWWLMMLFVLKYI
jgi:hypothetical protein